MTSITGHGYNITSLAGGVDINLLQDYYDNTLKKDEDINIPTKNITANNFTVNGTLSTINVNDITIRDRTTIFGQGNASNQYIALACQGSTSTSHTVMSALPDNGFVEFFKTSQNLTDVAVNPAHLSVVYAELGAKSLFLKNTPTGNAILYFRPDDANYIYSTDPTENSLIRFGIRTNNPTQAFETVGNVLATSGVLMSAYGIGTASQIGALLINSAFSSGGDVQLLFRTSHQSSQASIRGGSIDNLNKTYLSFRTNTANTPMVDTERMRLNDLGALTIYSSSADQTTGNLILRNQQAVSASNTHILFKNGVVGTESSGHQASIVSGHTTSGQTYISFRTNNTANSNVDVEHMRLNHLGNLGLGINAPTEKLHIIGNVRIEPTGTGANTFTVMNATGTANYGGLRFQRQGVSKWDVGVEGSLATVDEFYIYNHSTLTKPIAINPTTSTVSVNNILSVGDLINAPQKAVAPTVGIQNGSIYYDTATNKLRVRANGVWVDLH